MPNKSDLYRSSICETDDSKDSSWELKTKEHRSSANNISSFDVARYALFKNPKPKVTETVLIADLARKAAMSHYGRLTGKENSETLSGKRKDGIPLKGHTHAYYLPTDEDRDRYIDHLIIYAPRGFTTWELVALSRLDGLSDPYLNLDFALILSGFWQHEELSQQISIFKKSRVWISATPFLLGRYPKFKRNGQPRLNHENIQLDGPLDQLNKELQMRPQNGQLAEINKIGEPKYLSYRPAEQEYLHTRIGKEPIGPGIFCNLKIEFVQLVTGPISLGAHCHFGLGSFVPEGDI